METFEDFQNFVNEHPEITSMKILGKLYNNVYKKFYKHKFNKKIKFPGKKHIQSWKEYNDLKSIQNFINENNIHTRGEIDAKYRGLGVIIEKLKLYPSIKFVPKISLEEAQEYINNNKVKNLHDFRKNHKNIYLETFPFRSKLKFPHSIKNLSNYNTIEDFQQFINENKIETRKQFRDNYGGMADRFNKLKLDRLELTFPGDSPYIKYRFSKRFNTVEDVQNYIEEHGILTSEEFNSTEEGRYLRALCNRNHWKLTFKNSINNDWSMYNTAEDFQQFINDNDIRSPQEFSKRYIGLYGKLVTLRLCEKVNYKYKRKSTLEIKIEKILEDLNIPFERQKTFDDLKDLGFLRFDIYIPNYNIVIEPGGRQHFIPIERFKGKEGFEELLKHDKMKRDYCDEKGITLIYYFEDTSFHRGKNTPQWMLDKIKNYPGECYYPEILDKLIEKLINLKSGE